jgi:alkanesulfonate monooxygenase SsuD/methylene tetrahydromethanopterin reductase-like flavin-dependent oxidoreductase (luciferase family)
VILPETPWREQATLWRRAEALGFDHGWTYDHIAWRELRDEPWFGAMPTLTAAAVVTERMRIGTLVASPNFRHPVPFARDLLALDDVSNGRAVLGIGAGGHGWDATVLGNEPWSLRERTDRFVEFVELLDALLTNPVTTFEGRYYSADDAPMRPGCVQQPRLPFAVAATGPRGMRLAAEFGATWVTTGDRETRDEPPDAATSASIVHDQIERLTQACAAVGRDPSTIAKLVLTGVDLHAGLDSPDAFHDAVGRYAAAGVTDLVVHWPRPAGSFAGDVARFERILSDFAAPY